MTSSASSSFAFVGIAADIAADLVGRTKFKWDCIFVDT